ncbi:MAG TPA: hypothetical protein VGO40_12155 [Longimicrobium sp.]|jgi:hypothetical protein|nr:hypothetical protein [Longimicrobium sp.]
MTPRQAVRIVFALLSLVIPTKLIAQQPNGSLGDVRYSILDLTHFQARNGPGWVFMNGAPIPDSDLCRNEGICTLPDARGVFIRGMNVGRPSATGDVDSNRPVGAFQPDTFASHRHSLPSPLDEAGHTINGNGTRARIDVDDGPPWGGHTWSTTTNAAGSAETRPRNIALYTYIKINN